MARPLEQGIEEPAAVSFFARVGRADHGAEQGAPMSHAQCPRIRPTFVNPEQDCERGSQRHRGSHRVSGYSSMIDYMMRTSVRV